MKAIVSDIHANLEAFEAVLADIEAKGITEVYCLGDIIGYGPQPLECLDLCGDFGLNLLGNHEEAVLVGAVGFNPKAAAAIDWTRDQLLSHRSGEDVRNRRWNFLGALELEHSEDDVGYVHGSPREPTREYVFPTDHRDRDKMEQIFAKIRQTCFSGHTHTPGVFTEDAEYLSTEDCGGEWPIARKRALINVGSVGQPRDGDTRSSYVTFDGEVVRFQRVEYDVEKTISVFEAIRMLSPYLALRLREGR